MIASELKSWLTGTVLPFWAERGVDQATGAFHERLTITGTPDLAATRRLRVQARQIYVYAHAAAIGWYPDGKTVALRAFDAMMRSAHAPDGRPGFIHAMTPAGDVVSDLRDSYDHAFVILACAWLLRATGSARVRAVLDDTLDFADRALTAADGTLIEGLPPSEPRRQNPQMHWFEAMLALKAALDHPQARARADRVLSLFKARLFDAHSRTLGEYFDHAWQPAAGDQGQLVEPGHHAEWVWLLRQHETLFGTPRGDLASKVFESTLRWRDPKLLLLVDEGDRRGGIRRGTRRSWLQTELAKAWIAQAEAGVRGADREAEAALETLRDRHLGQPFAAGWIDQLDDRGHPLAGPVPASILYHVFVAVAEADRVLNASQQPVARPGTRDGRRALVDSVAASYALDRDVVQSLLAPFITTAKQPASSFAELKKQIPAVSAAQLEYNLSIVRRGERIFQMADSHRVPSTQAKVLDIGAGFGGVLIPFGRNGFELHGIEPDAARRSMCGRTLRNLGLEATFYDIDLCRQALDQQFDVIICNSVIEHVSDPDAMIARMAAMLRENGVLILGVANKDAIGNVLADPHYGTFGLTFLPNGLARRVYEAVEAKPQRYSVTEFYSIRNYIHQLGSAVGPVQAIAGEDSRTIADFPALFSRLGAGFADVAGRLRDPLLLRQFELHFARYTRTLLRAYAEAIENGTHAQFKDTYIRKAFHLVAVKSASETVAARGAGIVVPAAEILALPRAGGWRHSA